MVAYTYFLPAGSPGNVSRDNPTIEAQFIEPTDPPLAYGVPLAISANGNVRPIGAADVQASIYGLFVRPYPMTGGAASDPLGTSTPPTSGVGDVLKRGYMLVQLNGTTAAARDGTVYVRVANASTGKPIGGIEAAADSTNTIIMPGNTYFTGAADTNGVTEVAFNI